MRVTILGCGTAGGVPQIGGEWGVCDPDEPRNRRLRPSILVEQGEARLLVDASPDLRFQALRAGFDRLDAVLFTHAHADHTNGIDDLRYVVRRMGHRIDTYADGRTLRDLTARFGYIFGQADQKLYPPILNGRVIDGPFEVAGLPIVPFTQTHGPIDTLGFRFGPIAYSTDLMDLPDAAFAALEGVEVWIVDALSPHPHPTHSHLEQTLEWIERVKPKRAILTHMNVTMDYATVARLTPDHVEPAYDGMVIEVEG